MGALHEGHLSLIRAARQKCDVVAVSVFVNPTQFGPQEDLNRYPRPLDRDLHLLQQLQVDLAFTPDEQEIYPPGFSTVIGPPRVADTLEGQFRPGHFQGVATVVLKLLHIMPADWAFFGEKDYQQCLVIRDLVRDLDLSVRLQFCPTVREPDGLALSSRNRYLSGEQRQRALGLSRGLQQARQLFQSGERDCRLLEQRLSSTLLDSGVDRIDYAAVRDPETLQERSPVGHQAIALVAAYVGSTRLIDNRRLD
jgi:pantoate--beta-alanine ligase